MPISEPLSSIILICIIFFSGAAFYWFNKPRKKKATPTENKREKYILNPSIFYFFWNGGRYCFNSNKLKEYNVKDFSRSQIDQYLDNLFALVHDWKIMEHIEGSEHIMIHPTFLNFTFISESTGIGRSKRILFYDMNIVSYDVHKPKDGPQWAKWRFHNFEYKERFLPYLLAMHDAFSEVADVLEKQRKKDAEERQKIRKARMEAELKNVTCQK